MRPMLDQLLRGARPDLDAFIDAFGGVVPSLAQLGETPQDPEWHGEGDVHVHTQMVLDALYAELDGAGLTPEVERELILGAVFHDLAKPWTTRRMEIRGVERVAAPGHEAQGRSVLATALVDAGLPWDSLWHVMGLVGYHQEPKRLVVKGKEPAAFLALSRKVDPARVACLERADMRGRVCPDQADQLGYLDLFLLGVDDYAPAGWSGRWEAAVAEGTVGRSAAFRDRVFGEAIRALEAGRVRDPSEIGFLVHREPADPPELVVLCGPSGSGKSTFVERHLADHEVVSLDALREELAGDRSDQALNGAVRQEAKFRLKAALRPGRKVVWDATNLRADFRSAVCQLGFDYGALVSLVVFHGDRSSYAQRNRRREHAVPDRVVAAQLDQWEWPEVDEAHRLIVVDPAARVRGAFGVVGDDLPWGLRRAGA